MTRKITKLWFEDRVWEVGVNGVKLIEVQPPLFGVDYEDGHAMSGFAGDGTLFWEHKEQKIVIPDLTAPMDVKEAS